MPDSRKTAARRIEIVPAEERHVKAIGDLWWEFILFHQSIDPIWAPSDDSIEYFIEDHLRKFLGSDDRLALVATDGDTAIGYALAEINRVGHQPRLDDYGYIDQLAVTAGHRREGVGSQLYAEMIKWFRSKGIKRFEVGSTTSNETANAFWRKLGFRVYMQTLFRE